MVKEPTQIERTTRISSYEAHQLLQPDLDTETPEASSNIYEGIERALVSQLTFKLSAQGDLRCAQLLKGHELKLQHQSYLHTSAVETLSNRFIQGLYEQRNTESIPGLAQEALDGLDAWLLHNFVYRVSFDDNIRNPETPITHQLIYLNTEKEVIQEAFRYDTDSFAAGYQLFQDTIPGKKIPELLEAAILFREI